MRGGDAGRAARDGAVGRGRAIDGRGANGQPRDAGRGQRAMQYAMR